jgi:hypothetical protein
VKSIGNFEEGLVKEVCLMAETFQCDGWRWASL